MTLTKLEDLPPYGTTPCNDPGHAPPSHLLMEPGTYQWKCQACLHVVQFRVTGVSLSGERAGKVIVGTNR